MKVDVRLPGKGNSNSHSARPVHLIITMMKWIRTSRLPIKNLLSLAWQVIERLRAARSLSSSQEKVCPTSKVILVRKLSLSESGRVDWLLSHAEC